MFINTELGKFDLEEYIIYCIDIWKKGKLTNPVNETDKSGQ
jgi:hypothetical protein